MINFIPDLNRFDLASPPKWFLEELYTYDSDAVILPSRMEPVYRLTRKVKNAPRLLDDGRYTHPLVKVHPAPDTIMCAKYGVIPSLSFNPIHGWGPFMAELVARDMWRVGGAKKAAEILEAREAKDRVQVKAQISSDNYTVAGDMFLRFQHQSGRRVSLNSPLTKYNPFIVTPRKDVKPPTSGMRAGSRPLVPALDHPLTEVRSVPTDQRLDFGVKDLSKVVSS